MFIIVILMMESQECADVKSQQIMHFTHMQLIMLPSECNRVSQHEVMGGTQERMKITETEGGKSVPASPAVVGLALQTCEARHISPEVAELLCQQS